MSHLIEVIQEVKAQKMEEIARKEAEKKAEEDKKQQLRREKEKFIEECYLQCQKMLDESPCQELFQEVNTEIFKGKGKTFKTEGIDAERICNDLRTYDKLSLASKLVLKNKAVRLEARVATSIDRRGNYNPPCFVITCWPEKNISSYKSVLLKEIELADQPNGVIQEWKDEDRVRKAIAQVLVEAGVV